MKKNNTIKQLEPEYRPYEKFLKYGPEALTGAELLAIIIKAGAEGVPSVDLAKEILHSDITGDEDLNNIFDLEFEDLTRIRGIGKVKALQIKALAELSKRIAVSSARKRLKLTDPGTIAEYFYEQLRHKKCETVLILMLNSSCELIKEVTLSEGTVNRSLFSPREIYIAALRCEAVNIILLHNHPSGSPKPSSADVAGTIRVLEAGQIIGINLLDHIIIGDRLYFSMRKEGYFNESAEVRP